MNRLDLAAHTRAAKGFKAQFADTSRGLAGGDQALAWVELAWVLGKTLAHGTGHGQADVGLGAGAGRLIECTARAAHNLLVR